MKVFIVLILYCTVGDARNDLYLTVVRGEFDKGNKTSQKNIEVSVQIVTEQGEVLQVSET